MKTRKEIGNEGEDLAVNYLNDKGYSILERNWRWQKAEIDIIATNNYFIIFIEVKTRKTDNFGAPEDFISVKQQNLIIDAAHEYIVSKDIDLEARFDVISIVKSNGNNIKHMEEAFHPM